MAKNRQPKGFNSDLRYSGKKASFIKNKKIVLASQDFCGICGRQVDKTLKFPHPLSACIDHIIPINKSGHPSDLNNLQLAHLTCNRTKSDKLFAEPETSEPKTIGDRNLPTIGDWLNYRENRAD